MVTDYVSESITDTEVTSTSTTTASGNIGVAAYANLSSSEDFFLKGQVDLTDVAFARHEVGFEGTAFDVSANCAASSASAMVIGSKVYIDTDVNVTASVTQGENSINESIVVEDTKESADLPNNENTQLPVDLYNDFLAGEQGVIAKMTETFGQITAMLSDAEFVSTNIIANPSVVTVIEAVDVTVVEDKYNLTLVITPEFIDSFATAMGEVADLPDFDEGTAVTITLVLGESIESLSINVDLGFDIVEPENVSSWTWTGETIDDQYEVTDTYNETASIDATLDVLFTFDAEMPVVPTNLEAYIPCEDAPNFAIVVAVQELIAKYDTKSVE